MKHIIFLVSFIFPKTVSIVVYIVDQGEGLRVRGKREEPLLQKFLFLPPISELIRSQEPGISSWSPIGKGPQQAGSWVGSGTDSPRNRTHKGCQHFKVDDYPIESLCQNPCSRHYFRCKIQWQKFLFPHGIYKLMKRNNNAQVKRTYTIIK